MRRSFVLLSFLLAACATDGADDGDTDPRGAEDTELIDDTEPGTDSEVTETDLPDGVASVTLGAAGGVLEADGVRLVIPPGALDREVTLTVRPLASSPRGDAVSPAFDFGPDGLEFLSPAEVWIDHAGSSDAVVWWSALGDLTRFSPLATRNAAGVARAEVEHLSIGFVAGPPLADTDVAIDTDTDAIDTDTEAPADTDTPPPVDTDPTSDTDTPPPVDTDPTSDTDTQPPVDTDTPPPVDTDTTTVDTDTDTDPRGPDTGLGAGCVTGCAPSICGDGVVDLDEGCDDGRRDDGDGCSASCRREGCGNGVLDPGETCDDGNADADDACPPTCRAPSCGDRVVEPGEDCDDGNHVDLDGCDASCRFGAGCAPGAPDTGASDTDGTPPTPPPGCVTPPPTSYGGRIPIPRSFQLEQGADLAAGPGVLVLAARGAWVDGLRRAGRVDVWHRIGRDWDHAATITAPMPTAGGYFGTRPVTDGTTLVLGNGTPTGDLALYRRVGDTWVADGTLPGASGAWAVDGDRIVTTTPYDAGGRGTARLYERTGPGTWTFRDQLLGPATTTGLGTRVALSGTTLALQGRDRKLRLYRIEQPLGYTLTQTLSASETGDVRFDGDRLAFRRDAAVEVVRRDGSAWVSEGQVRGGKDPLRDTSFGFGDGMLALPTTAFSRHGLEVSRLQDGAWTRVAYLDEAPWTGEACPVDGDWNVEVVADGGHAVTLAPDHDGGSWLFWVDLRGGSCGDGQRDPNTEDCDDGNTDDGDGCGADCRVECGDGRLDAGETCDDGNTDDGDGCSDACRPEVCGNGVVDPGEECDDGATDDGDGCDAACLFEASQADLGGGSRDFGSAVDVDGDVAMISGSSETLWYRRTGATWSLVQSSPVAGVGAFDDTRAVVATSLGLRALSQVTGTWQAHPMLAVGATADVAVDGRVVVASVLGDLRVYRHDDTTLTLLDTVPHPAGCTYTSVAADQGRLAAWCVGALGGQVDTYLWDGVEALPEASWPADSPSDTSLTAGLALSGGLLVWSDAVAPGTCVETWWVRAVRFDGTAVDDLGLYGPVAAPAVATDGTSVFAAPDDGTAYPAASAQLLPDADWAPVALSGPIGATPDWRTTYTTPWSPSHQRLAVDAGWLVRGNASFSNDGVVFFTPIAP